MNNYMNGMGMNGLNPMQNYNMYYNKSSFPNSQESTIKGNTIWVQGYEGASAFRMEPNSLFVLLEDNLEKMYIKSTDNIGMCNGLRRFKLIEEKDEIKKSDESTDLSNYVRKDELQSLLLSMIPRQEVEVVNKDEMKEVTADVQPTFIRKTVHTND